MASRAINRSERVGEAFEFLAAGTYTLYNRAGRPAACARRVIAMGAQNWTLLRDASENDSPPGAVPDGFVFDADVSAITCSGSVLVVW